jgi:hypothetical protein
VDVTEIRRSVPRHSRACAVRTFIIHVRHSHTKWPLWIRRAVPRCSRVSVVLISSTLCTTPTPNYHCRCGAVCLGAPLCARCSFSASLAVPGCPWLPLAVPGCSWAAPGCSWLLLGCSWLLLAAPGCPWVVLVVPVAPLVCLCLSSCSRLELSREFG